MTLVNSHFRLAEKFYNLLPHRVGIVDNIAYRDYQKLILAQKICSKIVNLGLILQQALPKMLNPYEYLDKHFSKSEIENIYSFKNHTREQVLYIVSLRDPIGLLDDKTIADLFMLFRVSPQLPEAN